MGSVCGSGQGGGRERRPEVGRFDACFEPLAVVVRGKSVESVHRGAVAVVGSDGSLLGAVGDPGTRILLRSCAKPFQAAAVVAGGAADAFSLTEEEVAIMAASHAGAAVHVEAAGRLLSRAGLPVSALVCGPLEHACSGKHAGMLLLARHLAVGTEGYYLEDHPVQQDILRYMASLLDGYAARPGCAPAGSGAGSVPRVVFAGTDGCGVPVISVSLIDAARLFALLAAGATPALARVREAMLAHPALVAGEGRLDTTLISAGQGGVVAKAGAEGVQGIGLLGGAGQSGTGEGAAGAMGAAVKVEDGSGRSLPGVAAAILRAYGRVEAAETVERRHPGRSFSTTGAQAARIEPVVEPSALRRSLNVPPAGDSQDELGSGTAGEPGPAGRKLFGARGDHVNISRGDEKEVVRFLRDEWPGVDREYFGRPVEWTAEPYVLVYRRDKKVAGVLRGHFVGGLASVDELIVGEGLRGSGLGSLLLGRFEDESRRRRCSIIVLRAVKGSRAEDFYRKRGYHRECVQYGYEFGYDYVRLICSTKQALGEPAGREGKGER